MKSRIYQNNEIKHVCSCTKKQKQIFIFQTKKILQNCLLLLKWPVLAFLGKGKIFPKRLYNIVLWLTAYVGRLSSTPFCQTLKNLFLKFC